MDSTTADQLVELNRQFYQTFGAHFSATRGQVQPGVQRILNRLKGDESILDLGCGNGNLERALAQSSHRAPVLGLDFSLPLLEAAGSGTWGFPLLFVTADLTSNWDEVISEKISAEEGVAAIPSRFSLITAFATLHHIPSETLRLDFCRRAAAWLEPFGRFVLSNWQFLNSDRLRARLQPWSRVGLTNTQVDPGDYLLDWRSGGKGLRYVHHFDETELSGLAAASGFRVTETFYSDGQGGRLGLYQVWELNVQTG